MTPDQAQEVIMMLRIIFIFILFIAFEIAVLSPKK